MGIVLPFRIENDTRGGETERMSQACEIVIFPGVRIERSERDGDPSPSRRKLDGTHGRRRPRKTS